MPFSDLYLDRLALRPTEAAMLLGVSPATIRRMVAGGEIPSVLLRGSRRIPRHALIAWLDELAGVTR
jgi:excisionase family DNA binding protein